jgi:hypothetical protein
MLVFLYTCSREKEDKLNSLALTVRLHDQREHDSRTTKIFNGRDSRTTKVFNGKQLVFPAESYPSANDVLKEMNVESFPIVITFNYEDVSELLAVAIYHGLMD